MRVYYIDVDRLLFFLPHLLFSYFFISYSRGISYFHTILKLYSRVLHIHTRWHTRKMEILFHAKIVEIVYAYIVDVSFPRIDTCQRCDVRSFWINALSSLALQALLMACIEQPVWRRRGVSQRFSSRYTKYLICKFPIRRHEREYSCLRVFCISI